MTRTLTRRNLLLGATLVAATLTGASAAGAAGDGAPPGPGARCERSFDQVADSSAKHTLTSGGRDRGYVLRLPKGYDKRDDWPLVVALHGRGSTGVEVEGYSELSELPAVVVYPDGVADADDGDRFRRAWQGAPYEVEGVDDVAFTEDLLDELQGSLCVDELRTYATGKSNGGGLAALLAGRLPDRFAGVALVAAALYPGTQEGCDAAPAVPTLVVHGTADATIPYAGDARRELPDVEQWARERAERDDCRSRPRTSRLGRDVTQTQWSRCDGDSQVRLLAVHGGGHVWPGARVYSGGGHVTKTISTHQQVWTFFRKHELAAGAPQEKGDAR